MALEDINLNALLVFNRLAGTGSLSRTAKDLGTQKSTVSRQLAQLESALGTRLIHRTTRQWSLTEAGEAFREKCVAVVSAAESALSAVSQLSSTPSGLLRVTAPIAFGQSFLGPVLERFLRSYPEVKVAVSLTDRVVALVDEQVDVALRIGAAPDSLLIARKVASLTPVACASPAYLAQRGVPRAPQELSEHDCIPWNGRSPAAEWAFRWEGEVCKVAVRGRASTDNVELLRALAVAGMGIALLPRFLALPGFEDGSLRELLPGAPLAFASLLAVYPSGQHLAPKVRAFVDTLADLLGASRLEGSPRI